MNKAIAFLESHLEDQRKRLATQKRQKAEHEGGVRRCTVLIGEIEDSITHTEQAIAALKEKAQEQTA